MKNEIIDLLELIETSQQLNNLIKQNLHEIEFPEWSKKLSGKILPNYGMKYTEKPTQKEVENHRRKVENYRLQLSQQNKNTSVASKINQNTKLRKEFS
jgi:hypothetical protein